MWSKPSPRSPSVSFHFYFFLAAFLAAGFFAPSFPLSQPGRQPVWRQSRDDANSCVVEACPWAELPPSGRPRVPADADLQLGPLPSCQARRPSPLVCLRPPRRASGMGRSRGCPFRRTGGGIRLRRPVAHAERRLGQVVRAEGEELGKLGYGIGGEGGPGYLDHGADHVFDGHLPLGEHLLGDPVYNVFLWRTTGTADPGIMISGFTSILDFFTSQAASNMARAASR